MRNALGLDELRGIYGRIAERYDLQHALLTARSDQKGRRLLVENAVHVNDNVLDCGSGTGTTGILAAKKAGPHGKVTLFDLSDGMLAVAQKKVVDAGFQDRITFETGDIVHLPFDDGAFDVVLSTYSMCPLYDPARGALELYRVTRPGGRIGVAHSTSPENPIVRWLADGIESLAWRFPGLSMGCRPVEILSTFEKAGGKVLFSERIGVPLWPFLVFVVEKPTI